MKKTRTGDVHGHTGDRETGTLLAPASEHKDM